MPRRTTSARKRARAAVPPPPPLEAIVLTKVEACGFLRVIPRRFDELRRRDPRFPRAFLLGAGEGRGSALPRWRRADLEGYVIACAQGWATTGGLREGAFGAERRG